MKNIIITLSILFVTFGSIAQKKDSEESDYNINSNQLAFSYIGGGLNYDISFNNYNFTLVSLGPNFKYFNDKISFDASARFHLFENLANYAGRQPEITSIYENEKSRDFSLDFGYYFTDNIASKDISIDIAKKGNTRYYTIVNAKTAERFGVNLGFNSGVTYYNFQNQSFEDTPGPLVNGFITATHHQFSTIKLGGNRTRVNNIKFNTGTFGNVTYTKFSKLYFNVLILVSSELDDVFVNQSVSGSNTTSYFQQSINEIDRNRLGFAIGYELYSMNDYVIDDKKRDVGYAVEIGSQPGPKSGLGNNVFIDLKIRVNIGKIL
ncbi:MAG: hypothetical protein AB8B74_12510 [Crocinitomicaceae bacterium]